MAQLTNRLIQRFAGVVGVAAIASLATLPGFAQTMRPGETSTPASEGMMAPGDSMSTMSDVSMLDEEFFTLAYQGNNAEIQTSQMALERSQNQEIRQYAQRMISEHTLANEDLAEQANQLGITLPAEPVDPLNQAIAARLSELSGTEFDQAYMGAQANAHLRAIALYRTQVAQGQTPELKAYAAELLPSIAEHYEMASEMLPNYAADTYQPGSELQPIQ